MLNEEQSGSQPQKTALTKQDNLPALDVVKNRDGKDRVVARIKGKFTSVANARVLAAQKSIENILHMKDDAGRTQLEKILKSQAEVAEQNDDARNLGGISKFLEHVDEISGSKAAREALTREINTPVIPTVIMIGFPEGVRPMEAKTEVTAPSWIRGEVIEQNPAPTQDYPNGYWQGTRNRRHTKTSEGPIENDRRQSC